MMSPFVRNVARTILNLHQPSGRALWKLYYALRPRSPVYQHEIVDKQPKMLFDTIYETNDWKSEESRSGCSSTLEYTENLRRELPKLLSRLGVKSFLDAPCGDFNWMRTVVLPPGVNYVGGDIVEDMIEKLKSDFQTPMRQFVPLDILKELPPADLWMCRDTLFHFPESEIQRVLDNFRASKIKYMLTTNFNFLKINHDVNFGGFRYINLRQPPYNLPKPLMEIDDFPVLYPPRVMALWSREQLLDKAA